jgi:hypothetical protein
MARKQTNTVDFFPHLCGDDQRLIYHIGKRFGAEGYAVYYRTLEALALSDGHALDLSDELDLEMHADRCWVTVDRMNEIFDFIVERVRFDKELFEVGVIWCEKFTEALLETYKRSKGRDLPRKPIIQGVSDNSRIIADYRGSSTVEEKRQEEKRVDENGTPPAGQVQKERQKITVESCDKRYKNKIANGTKPANEHLHPADLWNNGHEATFARWWELYDMKQGQGQCEALWMQLNEAERLSVYGHSYYLAAFSEKEFRSKPVNYLKRKEWNDEIVDRRDNREKPTDSNNPNSGSW